MLKKLSDNDIIEGIRRQDEKALNYLYDNYFRMVKEHVLSYSGTNDDVPDVFQEAIILLYQKICEDDFKLTTDLKGYFFTLARNIWGHQLRHAIKKETLDFDLADENGEEDFSDPIFMKIVTRAFNKLKPDCQQMLKLYYDGLSFEEIAVKMNFRNESYSRRKKYLCKEAIMELIKSDPEFIEYQRFLK